jgi:hypothetical protein
MQPAGRDDEDESVIAGEQVEERGDCLDLPGVMEWCGNGKIDPDFGDEMPRMIVPLDRRVCHEP